MRIVSAFDRAERYDAYANVQQQVAQRVAARIAALGLPMGPRVLEIGCGTGFLGTALLSRLPASAYVMTDISPAMIDRARRRFGPPVRFAVMDGSAPDIEGPFELICSSLAMQWMPDLGAAVEGLRKLLSPDGRLVFATLAEGSFQEWKVAHRDGEAGTPDYPGQSQLEAMGVQTEIETITEAHGSATDFLRGLKAIGAGTPRAGHRPLSPARLRQVMRRFEEGGGIARYVVATCIAGPAQ